MPKPRCLVYYMQRNEKTPTNAELIKMGETVPLARECVSCHLRKEKNLEKICHIDL